MYLPLLLAAAAALGAAAPGARATTPPAVQGTFTTGGPTASGHWTLFSVDAPHDTFNVTVTYRGAKGWAGFGWHSVGSALTGMAGADYTVVEFVNGEARCSDRVLTPTSRHMAPSLDTSFVGGRDDITACGGVRANGNTTIWFVKKLDTGDFYDNKLTAGDAPVVWAHPQTAPFDEHESVDDGVAHGHDLGVDHGRVSVNFFTGETQQNTLVLELRTAHGMLMFLAYALFAPLGVFLARFTKNYYWWFCGHILVQSFMMVTAACAFGIALVMVEGRHFTRTHEWFGLVTILLTAVEPLLGLAAHLLWDPKRARQPLWPDALHAWIGRAAIACGWCSIFLGLIAYSVPLAAYYGALICMAFHLGLHLYVEIYRCAAKGKVLVV